MIKLPLHTWERIAFAILATFLGASLLYQVSVAANREAVLFGFSDDAFYYFKVARNVVSGYGFSFDTVHPTNGFQPLWMLVLLPIAALVKGEFLFLQIAAATQGALYIGTGLLLYFIARRFSNPLVALVVPLIWTYQQFKFTFLEGMESSLNAFVFALVVYLFFRYVHTPQAASIKQLVGFGFATGLLILSRLDNLVFAGFFAFVVLSHSFRRSRGIRDVLLYLLPVLVVAVPYFAWNLAKFGHLLPISASANMLTTRMSRELVYGLSDSGSWFWHLNSKFWEAILLIFETATFGLWHEPLLWLKNHAPVYMASDRLLMALLFALLVGALGMYYYDRKRLSVSLPNSMVSNFLGLLCLTGVHVGAFIVTGAGITTAIWHYAPEIVLITLWIGLAVAIQLAILQTKTRLSRSLISYATVVVFSTYVVLSQLGGYVQAAGHFVNQTPVRLDTDNWLYYRAALWIKKNTEPLTKIASVGGGVRVLR